MHYYCYIVKANKDNHYTIYYSFTCSCITCLHTCLYTCIHIVKYDRHRLDYTHVFYVLFICLYVYVMYVIHVSYMYVMQMLVYFWFVKWLVMRGSLHTWHCLCVYSIAINERLSKEYTIVVNVNNHINQQVKLSVSIDQLVLTILMYVLAVYIFVPGIVYMLL